MNEELVLKQVLEFIEMVLGDGNNFEISEFYASWTFAKIETAGVFFGNFNCFEK